jgi:hypothetical protein
VLLSLCELLCRREALKAYLLMRAAEAVRISISSGRTAAAGKDLAGTREKA